MYYKIYNITNHQYEEYNNIHILRFSYNPFYDSDSSTQQTKIEELLDELINQAHNNHLCFNSVYPWQDIKDFFDKNNEIIIAYNFKTNQIQGWCNLIYNSFNINNENTDEDFYLPINLSKKPIMVYTCYIDKLVTRALPKINYIGLLLLEFIRDITINYPETGKHILYYESELRNTGVNEYNRIKIDVIYLYSLTTSIDFYKKTFLTQLSADDSDKQDKILKHVFRYIRPDKIHRITGSFKKQLTNFYDMHIMDCKTLMTDSAIKLYNDFIAPKKCNDPNSEIHYKILDDDYIDYNVNRIYGSRTSRSIKSKSKSIIKK